MKSKIQSFFMKFISLFLCLSTLLGNSCLPTYAADTYQYISSFKTYGKDTFPEEYAYGVVDLASATKITKGSGVTTTTNVGTGNVENFIGYCGNNTSFSDAYSVTYTKGARYKNEYYDVKIRFRTTAKIGKTKEEKPQTGLKNPYFVGFTIGAFALAIGFVIFLNIRKKYE